LPESGVDVSDYTREDTVNIVYAALLILILAPVVLGWLALEKLYGGVVKCARRIFGR
jgi:hypothetical protein